MNNLLKCGLCCEETFKSKLAYAEHLTNVLANLSCPVCNNKWSSIAHLIEHLNLDECQPDNRLNDNLQESEPQIENPCSLLKTYDVDVEYDNVDEPDLTEDKFSINDEASENNLVSDGKVYIEILEKDKANLPLPTQELKLVSENGEQFVIMSTGGASLNVENGVVTSQNSDGTISFQTISDIKTPTTETVIAPSDTEREDNQEELYSCNTCGVSFSSVLEHIQNYHNDQEVVVEEPLDDEDMGIKYNSYESGDPLKQDAPKRVITDNGDIVDATDDITKESDPTIVKSEDVEKPKVQQVKRFVQIDKFCDSVVKNINQQETGGPYHKVIVKQVIVSGESVKTYYCMSCNIYVSNLDDFKTQPCKTFKYPCPYCPVAYENSKSLCAHMKVHKVKTAAILPKSSETFECEICSTLFQTNKSLKLHKRMHDPIKSRPIEPPIEMPDGTEGSSGRYRCNVCEKFIPIDYRTIHQNSHKTDHKMNCGICNKKFLSAQYLEMHMSVHNMDKVPTNKNDKSLPYCCLYCDRRFARPHEKVKHERIHTGEKPHSCEICGKSFRVAYCLTLHMRTHTGARPYACPLCNKRFKAHSVYNHHLLTHSAVRRYKCPFCPKAFKTSVQLAGHKNSHTKPFSCTHCNRPFASLYAVRVHTETHSRQNNLKFSCSLCGASYARAFALKDHVKQIHQQDVDTSTLNAASEQAQANLKEQANWTTKRNKSEGEIITPEINELDMATDPL